MNKTCTKKLTKYTKSIIFGLKICNFPKYLIVNNNIHKDEIMSSIQYNVTISMISHGKIIVLRITCKVLRKHEN